MMWQLPLQEHSSILMATKWLHYTSDLFELQDAYRPPQDGR